MDALFRNCDFCLDRVSYLIDPILMASSLCQRSCYYLQGIVVDGQAFLATNLPGVGRIHLTPRAQGWTLGRDPACDLVAAPSALSPRHAHLDFHSVRGFYLAPAQTSPITVNGCPLKVGDQRLLQDGDLLQLGTLAVEFFCEVACPIEVDLEADAGAAVEGRLEADFGPDRRMLA